MLQPISREPCHEDTRELCVKRFWGLLLVSSSDLSAMGGVMLEGNP